jgi:hypothetical protein
MYGCGGGWATHFADLQATEQKQPWNGTLKDPDHEAVPEHGAEQSSKRAGIKAKHGMKSKYRPKIESDGETL